jgi:flagellar protein FlaJ
MIRLMDRGHPISGFLHFVLLTWVGALVSVLTEYVVGGLIA